MSESAEALASETLAFLVTEGDEAEDREKGIFGRRENLSVRRIPIAVLRDNLHRTVTELRKLFDEISTDKSGMPLKQVQVQFEVTATGGITLVGTAQIASKSAITLTFGT